MRLRDAANSVSDPEDEDQLRDLDAALESTSAGINDDLVSLFLMFERHPDSDGFGVFWSALHWLEAQPSETYEKELLQSIERKPVPFTLNMINRMLNGGFHTAAGSNLLDLLNRLSTRSDISQEVKEQAVHLFIRHSSRTDQSA